MAFNYRALIRQVLPRTWQYYFRSRSMDLPAQYHWAMPPQELIPGIIAATEALAPDVGTQIYAELRRVHALANRHGIDALCNAAAPDATLHDDLAQLSSDAERALWVMANWPERFHRAEAICGVNLRIGKRGWKRLRVAPGSVLFRASDDLRALEAALGAAFTPRKDKERPRGCEIDDMDRHLDGGLQLSIRIEDDLQRQLEFDERGQTFWRDARPPLLMDVIIYPESGVIDLLLPGGKPSRDKVLKQLGRYIFRKTLAPQPVQQPVFFLNRLRNGLELPDDAQVDLAACRIQHLRLSQAKLRAVREPHCDYTIKPPSEKTTPDVFACLKAHCIDQQLLSHGFNITHAVVSVYFLPLELGRAGRVLHIDLKPVGIGNLRDMSEADAQLAQALLRAWGVMQPAAPAGASPAPAFA